MNRSIIRKIAKQNGVSTAEVRSEMQIAIEAAFKNPNAMALAVPRKSEMPTPEEFTNYCVHMVSRQPLNTRLMH